MVISNHGYIKIYVGYDHVGSDANGYVYEHRMVASKILGRWPKRCEIVHHINGDRKDNRLENLKIVKGNGDHYVHHRKRKDLRFPGEENIEVACECGCGKTFIKYDGSGRPRKYVSGHNMKDLKGTHYERRSMVG